MKTVSERLMPDEKWWSDEQIAHHIKSICDAIARINRMGKVLGFRLSEEPEDVARMLMNQWLTE